jgi:hypothetical protein
MHLIDFVTNDNVTMTSVQNIHFQDSTISMREKTNISVVLHFNLFNILPFNPTQSSHHPLHAKYLPFSRLSYHLDLKFHNLEISELNLLKTELIDCISSFILPYDY